MYLAAVLSGRSSPEDWAAKASCRLQVGPPDLSADRPSGQARALCERGQSAKVNGPQAQYSTCIVHATFSFGAASENMEYL